MIEQLIQRFSESWCFAPTFGCASLLAISFVLYALEVPIDAAKAFIGIFQGKAKKKV